MNFDNARNILWSLYYLYNTSASSQGSIRILLLIEGETPPICIKVKNGEAKGVGSRHYHEMKLKFEKAVGEGGWGGEGGVPSSRRAH